jgi:DNA replication protein DnaC
MDTKKIIEQLRLHGFNLPQQVRINAPVQVDEWNAVFTEILSPTGKRYVTYPEYTDALAWLQDNRGKGLMLMGTCGTGKSMICRFVLPTLLLQHTGRVVRSIHATELRNKWDEATRHMIVSVDDFGTEEVVNNYGNKEDLFAKLVELCERENKLLIANTNLSAEQIRARYGDRTLDRLIGLCKIVKINQKSLR